LKIASARLFPIRLMFRHLLTNAQQVIRERSGVLVRLTSDAGREGWGEASPFPGFGLESVEDARRSLEVGTKELLGREIDREAASDLAMDDACPSARGALESALLDLAARARGETLRTLLSDASRPAVDVIECNALIAASGVDAVEREARAAQSGGFQTFKMKVGALGLDQDVARIRRLRDVVGPEVKIRLDANQAYTPETALAAIERFAVHEIEYLEQPLAADAIPALAALRATSPVRIAADESATTEATALRVIDAGAADVIVVKPSAIGGPLASMRIARLARRASLDVVVTSMLDGAVALGAALQVAAVLAGEGKMPACGLATSTLFDHDVAVLPPVVDGRVHLSLQPGIGLDVKRMALRTCLAGPAIDVSA